MNGPDFGLWLFWKVMKWPLVFCVILVTVSAIFAGLGEKYGPIPPILLGLALIGAIVQYIRRRLPQNKRAI